MATFQEEINELKTQEEAQAEDVQEVEQGEEDLTEAESEIIEDVKIEPSEEEKKAEEVRIKQEAYNKRKEARAKKQEEALSLTRKPATSVENQVAPDELEALKQVAKQMQGQQMFQAAKKELTTLEADFSEVYTDYPDVVGKALAFTKQTLVAQGLSEAEAELETEKQKIIIADRAAASGHDPVEVVYKKAQSMNKAFELYAEKMGYKKIEKETNLDKARKINNPTAVGVGGSGGKGSHKALKNDPKAIEGMTIGEMLKASREGRL